MRALWDRIEERVTPWGALLLACTGILFLSGAAALLTRSYLEHGDFPGARMMFAYSGLATFIAMAGGVLWGLGMSGWRRGHS